MSAQRACIGDRVTFDASSLNALFDALAKRGCKIIGPTARDGAVVCGELTSANQLPQGMGDNQDSARYRLMRRNDGAYFGFNLGPHSIKKLLLPPQRRLWSARRKQQGFAIEPEAPEYPKYAFLGVRPCEIAALMLLDNVLAKGEFKDPAYVRARKDAVIIALNCSQAGGTCFCASMNTGPKATSGFDLALTEVIDSDRHYFVAEIGSNRGAEIASEMQTQLASPAEIAAAEKVSAATVRQMGRALDIADIRGLLTRNFEHPRWAAAAERCLTCGNCTMVCPTCFCTTVADITDLTGQRAERRQRWDSCFTMDFTYIHGGSIRASTRARYRQMVTHKLSSWVDQFGASGCVGCGRCITWCPAAIDITEEVRAIRESERALSANVSPKESKYANA
jgi:ferredoxin